jgi:hypothetical protein
MQHNTIFNKLSQLITQHYEDIHSGKGKYRTKIYISGMALTA